MTKVFCPGIDGYYILTQGWGALRSQPPTWRLSEGYRGQPHPERGSAVWAGQLHPPEKPQHKVTRVGGASCDKYLVARTDVMPSARETTK